eukprot:41333_1
MGKKYNVPLQELTTNIHSHDIDVPLNITCPSNAKYNRSVSLQLKYGADIYLYDLLSEVEQYISCTLRTETKIEFEIAAISWKSFTNKTVIFDDELKSKKWLKSQMQYESIAKYKEADVIRKGVHIEIKAKGSKSSTAAAATTSTASDEVRQVIRQSGKLLDGRLRQLYSTSDVAYCNFDDIMYNFRKKESELYCEIDCNYVENKQTSVSWNMRSVLVDWLYDLQIDLRLNEETLFASINYIDLFLSKCVVSRQHLQLLGVTAIMIASKTYEVIPQPIAEWIYLSHDQYTRRQLINLEKKVLKLINWNVFQVTPYNYIHPWAQILEIRKGSREMFVIDLLIQSVSLNKLYLEIKLSKLITAIFYLCFIYLNTETENPIHSSKNKSMKLLATVSQYNPCESKSINNIIIGHLNQTIVNLIKNGEKDSMTCAIFRKFTNKKYINKHYDALHFDIKTFQFNRIFNQFQNKQNRNM